MVLTELSRRCPSTDAVRRYIAMMTSAEALFDSIDADKSGTVDADELLKYMLKAGVDPDEIRRVERDGGHVVRGRVGGSLAELRRRLAEVARRYGREGVLALLEHGADVAHPERYAIPQVLRADGNRVAVALEPVCTVLLRSGADVLHVSRAPLLDQRLSRKCVRWAKPFVRWTWDITWSFEF